MLLLATSLPRCGSLRKCRERTREMHSRGKLGGVGLSVVAAFLRCCTVCLFGNLLPFPHTVKRRTDPISEKSLAGAVFVADGHTLWFVRA